MENGISLKALPYDADNVELHISASNGCFSGYTEIYIARDFVAAEAERLLGFPSGLSDARVLELGKGKDLGGIEIRLACRDRSFHISAVCKMRSEDCLQSALIAFNTEPGAVDAFAEQLQNMASGKDTRAVLQMTI